MFGPYDNIKQLGNIETDHIISYSISYILFIMINIFKCEATFSSGHDIILLHILENISIYLLHIKYYVKPTYCQIIGSLSFWASVKPLLLFLEASSSLFFFHLLLFLSNLGRSIISSSISRQIYSLISLFRPVYSLLPPDPWGHHIQLLPP